MDLVYSQTKSPNRTDVECPSNYRIYYKAEIVIEALSGQSSEAVLCRRHNITEEQLSQWKRQLLENAASLFESNRKQSDAAAERIAELEQLAGRLKQALDIQKKALDWIALNRSEE